MYINVRNTRNQFCTYSLTMHGAVIFIGACRYADLMQFDDANKNSEFVRMVKHSDWLEFELIATHPTLADAKADQRARIETDKPHCNINGKTFTKSSRVRCVTTGAIFDNAAQACIATGVSRASMSNHLNRRAGYETVKKLQFEYE